MNSTTRRTPVPGHRRRGPLVRPAGYQFTCACGWQGYPREFVVDALGQHTAHKDAVRTGEFAALFEAQTQADLTRRAEPHGLIEEVNARIDARARGLIDTIQEDRS